MDILAIDEAAADASGKYSPRQAELFDSYADQSDGTYPRELADSGQTMRKIQNPTAGSALVVASGALTNTATTGSPAGYAELTLPKNVTRLGARFKYATGTTYGGVACLIMWQNSIVDSYPSIPNAGCHLTISPDRWEFAVFVSGTLTKVKDGYFSPRLAMDGTEYEAEAVINGSEALLRMPDGTHHRVVDSRIAQYAGPNACHEVYQLAAATDDRPAFTQTWAASNPMPPYGAPPAVGSMRAGAERKLEVENVLLRDFSDTSYVAPLRASDADIVNVSDVRIRAKAPASGKILFEVTSYVEVTAECDWTWYLRNPDNNTILGSALAVSSPYKGQVTVKILVQNMTAGLARDFRLGHAASVAAAAKFRTKSAWLTPISITAHPLL